MKLSQLNLMGDEFKQVSCNFGIQLYTDLSFYKCPQKVLKSFEQFLKLCPQENLKFFGTETSKVHKPVTKKTFSLLDTWLGLEAPHKNYIALELKSGDVYQDAPDFKYEVWSVDASKQAKSLTMALPIKSVEKDWGKVVDFVQALASTFPFRSGLAGLAFECSRYARAESETFALSKSQQHPEIDIVRVPFDVKAVGQDGIKGIGWLTCIDDGYLKELGGQKKVRAQLSKEIKLIDVEGGVLFQIGSSPILDESGLDAPYERYAEVAQLLSTYLERAAKRSMAFHVAVDSIQKTDDWHMRFIKQAK